MKKILSIILCLIMFLSALPSASAENFANASSYSNFDIIKELANAYDRQGAQIPYDQYNARRSIYSSPEDATAQRTIFLDCSSYVNSCYREAFGVNVLPYEIGATGTSPSTANFDKYAKENPNAIDVVGYWEPLTDCDTDEKREAVVDFIYGNLQIGDIITYRHGKDSGAKGHVYIYVGETKDKEFMHCAGAGSYIVNSDNPALSYDSQASEIETGGTIDTESKYNIFENARHKRYIFKKTESDTVYSFAIIRPFARGLTPTEETINRMKIAGLSMEKISSVCENNTVTTGDVLTYTIVLENTNTSLLTNVTISDTIPHGAEFVSGDNGVSINGNNVSWVGDVPGQKTVNVSYSVRITETVPGTLIISDSTYVSGVKLGKITHSVSNYTENQKALIAEAAIKYAKNSSQFTDGIAMAKEIYKTTLGVDIFDYITAKDVLDQLIDTESRTKHTLTHLSQMIAPNLYGGQNIKYGWLYLETENDKTRLPKEEHLSVGDIIVADWENGSNVYVYAGNKTLVTVADGICKSLTIGDDIYKAGENILISLLGYNRYAVLRPSMSHKNSDVDVKSISIKTNPVKTEYFNGQSFYPDGMVVEAALTNGSFVEIENYTFSPKKLASDDNCVTVRFGNKTATVNVTVVNEIKSVREALNQKTGTNIMVEGIIAGVANEGNGGDSELILKDVSSDTLIAVRNIPYGTFPDFGYDKGDRIIFKASVEKDTSASTSYSLKKYLNFSSENGDKKFTIVSKNNEIIYNFDSVTELNSWDDMKTEFVNKLEPYTYFKVSAGSYLYPQESNDKITNYIIHKNSDANGNTAIKTDGRKYITLRDDVMSINIGSSWKDFFFKDEFITYPGTHTQKEFYAVYIGGNDTYCQFVILEDYWINSDENAILKLSNDKKTAIIRISDVGEYAIIFANYEKNTLLSVNAVPVTVTKEKTGILNVPVSKNLLLDTCDKIMLWDMKNCVSLCNVLVRYTENSEFKNVIIAKNGLGSILSEQGMPQNYELLKPISVIASDEPQEDHLAPSALDNDFSTSWTSDKESQYIEIDLGEIKEFDGFALAFKSGNSRTYKFEIMHSNDKRIYTRVFNGESSGKTAEFESLKISGKARYIRLVGHFNSESTWNNLSEIHAYKLK